MKINYFFTPFILLITGLLNFQSKAQTNIYYPLPVDSAYWVETHYEYFSCLGVAEIFNYRIERDTIINGLNYQVISRTYANIFCSYPWSYNDFSYAYLREDSLNKKVFCIIPSKGINNDSLLYDFDLNIGDTIPLGILNPYNDPIIVTSIDSFFYENSYKKEFILNLGGPLIEGIGSGSGLFERMPGFPLDYHVLTCFVVGDSGIADYPSTGSCPLIITNTKENKFISEKTTIIPNPLSDVSIIKFSNNPLIKNQISIYNSIGEIVLRKNTQSDEIKIYRKELQPGFYVVETSSSDVNKKSFIKLIVQ